MMSVESMMINLFGINEIHHLIHIFRKQVTPENYFIILLHFAEKVIFERSKTLPVSMPFVLSFLKFRSL